MNRQQYKSGGHPLFWVLISFSLTQATLYQGTILAVGGKYTIFQQTIL